MGAWPHKRWIPKQDIKTRAESVVVIDCDPVVAEIIAYYHTHHLTPNDLPREYKDHLLARGIVEQLATCPDEYLVFTQIGSQLAKELTPYNTRRKESA